MNWSLSLFQSQQVELVCLLDEWSQQEMEMFSRCLIESNKDFGVVAKKVASPMFVHYFTSVC